MQQFFSPEVLKIATLPGALGKKRGHKTLKSIAEILDFLRLAVEERKLYPKNWCLW
jgi:hypothetical protein